MNMLSKMSHRNKTHEALASALPNPSLASKKQAQYMFELVVSF